MLEKWQRAFLKALTPDLIAETPRAREASMDNTQLAPQVLSALGGVDNLKSQQRIALTRMRVQLHDGQRLDVQALHAAGMPGVMVLAGGVVHLID